MAKWWKASQCHKPNALPGCSRERTIFTIINMMQFGLWEAFLKVAFMLSSIIPSTSQEQCGFSKGMTTLLFLILSTEGYEGMERTREGQSSKWKPWGTLHRCCYTQTSSPCSWKGEKGEKALKGRHLKLGENNSSSVHANTLLVGHGTGGAWQYYY